MKKSLLLLGLLFALPLPLAACGGADNGADSAEPNRELSSTPRIIEDAGSVRVRDRAVDFNAFDGLNLKGTYYSRPEATALVLLLHSSGADRSEWDAYVSAFYEAGWDVLALDMRGQGESNEYVIAGGRRFRANPLALRADDAIADIGSVIEQLPDRYQAKNLPMFVVGAEAGGNVAWLSTGVHEQVVAAVALSAVDTRPDGPLSGDAFPDATPRDVLFVAGPADLADARNLAETVAGDVQVLEAAEGAGVDLLGQEGTLAAVLAWIRDRVPADP